MEILFSDSKEGIKTFSAEGLFYHSKYSPLKEAQRFVNGISLPYNPKIIFFIEPGLSYCVDYLHQKYPDTKLAAIRLFSYCFKDKNKWDFEINFTNKNDFIQSLLNSFGEDILLSSTILIWPPAKSVFGNIINQIIEAYTTALNNSKTLLITRQFFEKKWLVNSCNFLKYLSNPIQIENSNTTSKINIVICASGPSLEPALKALKQKRNSIFIICLSSATSVLLQNKILPDLILSTDGGWWAGKHLKPLYEHPEIPLAAPLEAFIPKKILSQNPVLPLKYNDTDFSISNSIIEKTDLFCYEALRNPTVSGTALYLAKSLVKNFNSYKVFFCGLDLCASKGFQHTKPNMLEADNMLTDNRLSSVTKRQNISRFNSESLKIYEDWFCGLKNIDKTFRVIDQRYKNNTLGKIIDISYSQFEDELLTEAQGKINFVKACKKQIDYNSITNFILQNLDKPQFQKQLFPADFISLQNISNETEKQSAQNRLNAKIVKLAIKIGKLADD